MVKRTTRNLSDQFSYLFDKAIDGEMAGYFVAFRNSFAILGIVDPKGAHQDLSLREIDILRPLPPRSVG